MKLAVIFEVPDGQAETYADVANRMIQHHAFSEQQEIGHWSFDQAMRPVAAIAVEADQELSSAILAARSEMDQDHPWIPGGAFLRSDRLKPILLAFLQSIGPKD